MKTTTQHIKYLVEVLGWDEKTAKDYVEYLKRTELLREEE